MPPLPQATPWHLTGEEDTISHNLDEQFETKASEAVEDIPPHITGDIYDMYNFVH